MYNLIVCLSVIIIALIVVFVAYAQVTNEIIKHYQKELKKEQGLKVMLYEQLEKRK